MQLCSNILVLHITNTDVVDYIVLCFCLKYLFVLTFLFKTLVVPRWCNARAPALPCKGLLIPKKVHGGKLADTSR